MDHRWVLSAGCRVPEASASTSNRGHPAPGTCLGVAAPRNSLPTANGTSATVASWTWIILGLGGMGSASLVRMASIPGAGGIDPRCRWHRSLVRMASIPVAGGIDP